MVDSQKARSWWQTFPGVLTAVAGLVTAMTGLIVALDQTGIFEDEPAQQPQLAQAPADAPSAEAGQPRASQSATGDGQELNARVPSAAAAKETEPTVKEAVEEAPALSPLGDKINLLSAENGGELVVASSADWKITIDGATGQAASLGIGTEAVFAFEGDRSARFDAFRVFVPGTDTTNLQEFELLAGDDSPTGKFKSLGRFKTQNLLSLREPFQEIKLPQTRARYLKMRILSSYGHSVTWNYEFQLMGRVDE